MSLFGTLPSSRFTECQQASFGAITSETFVKAPDLIACRLNGIPIDELQQQQNVYLSIKEPAGTDTAGSTALVWNLRTLNTLDSFGQTFCTLVPASGEFTLQPGQYYMEFHSMANLVGFTALRIRSISTNKSYYGLVAQAEEDMTNVIVGCPVPVPDGPETFVVEHWTQKAFSPDAFGYSLIPPGSVIVNGIPVDSVADLEVRLIGKVTRISPSVTP